MTRTRHRAAARPKLSLVAYAVPKVGFDKVIPAFDEDPRGQGRHVQPVLRRLRRPVAQGGVRPADRRRQLQRRARHHPPRQGRPGRRDWNQNEHKGIPFGSVVTIVVRKGNPKGIKTWDDLLKPGVEVVTPNPFSSGSRQVEPARPLRREERRRQEPAGRPRLPLEADRRPHQGAAEVRPRGDRDLPPGHRRRAAHLRERGAVRRAQRRGRRARHARHTFKIENPVAVVNTSKHTSRRKAFVDFLYTPRARRRGPRPASARSTRRSRRSSRRTSRRPRSSGRSTTSAAGARSTTSSSSRRTGSVAKIYNEATS